MSNLYTVDLTDQLVDVDGRGCAVFRKDKVWRWVRDKRRCGYMIVISRKPNSTLMQGCIEFWEDHDVQVRFVDRAMAMLFKLALA